jgi:hypothetical protein
MDNYQVYAGMAKTRKSTDVNLTAFQILEALTGELPCHASPDWKVSDKKEDPPKQNPSAVTLEVPEEVSRNFLR